jgi:OFA family oxalate/formate antiporter-like MFS transporter
MKERTERKTVSRRHVLTGAVLAEMCMGLVNAGGAFTARLCDRTGPYAWTLSQADWISSAALVAFVVAIVISERLRERFGQERTMLIGGILMGVGYVLGGALGKTFAAQLIFIGIVVGAGAGMGFLVPFLWVVRWFPEKKGMALGMTFSAFWFGAVLWSKGAEIGFTINLMGLGGVQSVYLIFGTIVILTFVAVRKRIMSPYQDVAPLLPMTRVTSAETRSDDFSELIRRRPFYLTGAVFFLSAFAGIMILEYILPYGTFVLKGKGLEIKIAAKVAELAFFASQILLAAGCIFWGFFSDRTGRRLSFFLMCVLQGAVVLLYPYSVGSPQSIVLFSSLVGFIAGGNSILIMLLTADYFGDENMGSRYALLFPAYGLAALSAPHVASCLKDAASGSGDIVAWNLPFFIAGTGCFFAAFITFLNKPPVKR